ncbi:hypothetical protein LUZ60_011802 [Juncus effusus]|nr:hypothetical protein LUZ60_011802 [Juncus effusus]
MDRKMKRVRRTKTDRRTPNSGSDQEWRDWTTLPADIVITVATMLLSYDIMHYIRFRGICKMWRECTVDPSTNPTEISFRPKNWIPVKCDRLAKPSTSPETKDEFCFLNISLRKYVRLNTPELNSGFRFIFAVQGHLLSGVEYLPSSEIMLFFSELHKVVYAKPGEERWVAIRTDKSCISALFFSGRLFAVTRMGELLQFKLNSQNEVRIIVPEHSGGVYLVECEGQMLVVLLFVNRFNQQAPHFQIYKFDLDNRSLIRTRIPFGYALVISVSTARGIAISTTIFRCMQRDCIYLGSHPLFF